MPGTGRVHLGDKQSKFWLSPSKLTAKVECPVRSALIDVNAATGTIVGVYVPDGAYVYRVAVLAETAVVDSSTDINVGDGSSADRYIDGLAALAANDMVIAPNVASGTACDEVGGHYYATNDSIDVTIVGTASAGSIRLLVWYDIIDTRN